MYYWIISGFLFCPSPLSLNLGKAPTILNDTNACNTSWILVFSLKILRTSIMSFLEKSDEHVPCTIVLKMEAHYFPTPTISITHQLYTNSLTFDKKKSLTAFFFPTIRWKEESFQNSQTRTILPKNSAYWTVLVPYRCGQHLSQRTSLYLNGLFVHSAKKKAPKDRIDPPYCPSIGINDIHAFCPIFRIIKINLSGVTYAHNH